MLQPSDFRSADPSSERNRFLFHEGPTLETLDFTIRIGSTLRFVDTENTEMIHNDPQWSTTTHSDPQRPTVIHNDPQWSTTIQNDQQWSKTTHKSWNGRLIKKA